jgi:micrococcal nuclease
MGRSTAAILYRRLMHRVMLASMVVVLVSCGAGSTTTTTAPPITTGQDAVTVVTIVDGDSLEVLVDGTTEEVRLLGINAPEREECYFDEARAHLTELMGGEAMLTTHGRDQFGRLLAYVTVHGMDVNRDMLRAGAAIAMSSPHERRSDYIAAEGAAVMDGIGLFSGRACPGGSRSMIDLFVEADPSGPDEDNLDLEFVVVTNYGDQPADLSGWALRDESSVNRFAFPIGTLLDPGEEVTVHTSCGDDGPGDLYWCATGPVWNNDGDTAILLDPGGNPTARYRYFGD